MNLSGPRSLRLPVVAVVGLLAVSTACGSSTGSASDGSSGSSTPSSSSSSSSSPSSPSPSATSSATADGRCGGGAFPTQVVRAAQGVRVTVPADWGVASAKAGAAVRLTLPSGSDGDGYLVVQHSKQTLAQVVADVEKSTRASAEVASESRPRLSGFEAALATDFSYDGGEAFSVDVVAVGDGFRVLANMAGDRDDATHAAALSCLSTLSRKR